MIFHLFKTLDSKGRVYAAPVDALIGAKIKGTLPDGTPTEVTIDTPESIVTYFGADTQLFDVTTIDYLKGASEVNIEQRLMHVDGNGKMVRQAERYNAVLMDIAITSWTLSEPKSEEGFLSLPAVVGSTILKVVTDHLFGFDFPSDTKN